MILLPCDGGWSIMSEGNHGNDWSRFAAVKAFGIGPCCAPIDLSGALEVSAFDVGLGSWLDEMDTPDSAALGDSRVVK
jgi:hypothetical protein